MTKTKVDAMDKIGLAEFELKNINCIFSDVVEEYFRNGESDYNNKDNQLKILWEHERYAAYMCVIENALHEVREQLSELYKDLYKEHKNEQLNSKTAAATLNQ